MCNTMAILPEKMKDHTITIPWNYHSLVIHTRIHSEDIFLDNKEDVQASSEAPMPPVTVAPQPSKSDKEFIDKLDRIINENLSSDKLSIKFLTDTLAMSRASLYN